MKRFCAVLFIAVAGTCFAADKAVVGGENGGTPVSVSVSSAPAEDTRTNVEKLTDPNWMVRRNAVIFVGAEGRKETVKSVLPLIDDASIEVQRAAIDALSKLGDKENVPPALAAKFRREKNYAVKLAVITALGDLKDKSQLALVRAQLKDQFPNMRNEALRSLGKINDKSTYSDIVAMLKDEAEGTRIMAADVSGKLKLPAAVEQLKKNLNDQAALVRRYSVKALGEIGEASSLSSVERLISDPDATVSAAAKEAADRIKGASKDSGKKKAK